MICHLVGTSDAVASAEKLINEVLAEAEAGASAGGGTRRMAAQSGGDEFSMQIPNNKVGLIIGKGGETIKSMQASTGARIQITFNVKHQLRMEDRIWIQLQSGSEFRCGGFSENRRMYYLGFELISEFASVPNWGGLPRLILALLTCQNYYMHAAPPRLQDSQTRQDFNVFATWSGEFMSYPDLLMHAVDVSYVKTCMQLHLACKILS
ncbi:hypothetical protein KIW84_036063 [Lathyrus oleraceus]|uniref:K Homology domain-containing protein n=1 Tax=Pisum sativum TaxID=3888 RepID=A0A9D4Y781_PEA|nr:hypothetical protein KIW84_036063 [Pisum sativum]